MTGPHLDAERATSGGLTGIQAKFYAWAEIEFPIPRSGSRYASSVLTVLLLTDYNITLRRAGVLNTLPVTCSGLR